MPNKIYIFAGGQKVAEGKGLVLPSDKPDAINSKPWGDANADPMQQMQNALDDFKLREKIQIPEPHFAPKENTHEWHVEVKISKRRWRKIRQMAMGKKSRLPRKLKKAARHVGFDVFDPQMQTDALSDRDRMNFTIEYDLRARIHPEGYPRTKWVQRLIHRWLREMNQMHKRFVKRAMFEQYLDQHQGMLTYDPAPLTPSPEVADMLRRGDVTINPYYPHAQEMVLDRKHLTNLANIINNKEDEK